MAGRECRHCHENRLLVINRHVGAQQSNNEINRLLAFLKEQVRREEQRKKEQDVLFRMKQREKDKRESRSQKNKRARKINQRLARGILTNNKNERGRKQQYLRGVECKIRHRRMRKQGDNIVLLPAERSEPATTKVVVIRKIFHPVHGKDFSALERGQKGEFIVRTQLGIDKQKRRI